MIIHQRIPEADLRRLNQKIKDYYGITYDRPSFRVIWSEDQLEKKLCYQTDSGVQLLEPEIREVPKYRQWVQNKYILEGLTIVPDFQQKELASQKLSYEPIWVFEKDKNAVYPSWGAVRFVLETLKRNVEGRGYTKYADKQTQEEALYERKLEIDKLQEEMFGNESDVADALAYKEGIVVPGGQNGN